MADPSVAKVVFIVGAGHSIAAGAPSTERLTSWISAGGGPVKLPPRVKPDQIKLFRQVEAYLAANDVSATYESVFTWLWTAYFSSDKTMYRGSWAPDAFAPLNRKPSKANDALVYSTRGYVEEVVWRALDRPADLDKAPALTLEAAADSDVEDLTIITLNHDRLLELLMQKAGITYSDGFAVQADGSRIWSSSTPDTRDRSKRVQLIKLHGSIDWWSPSPWNDAGHVVSSRKRPHDCTRTPLVLVGTGPKLFQASNLMFARQILDAGQALARATCVIVVGYSFGDVRMNSLWHGAHDERRFDGEVPLVTLNVDPSSRETIQARVGATARPESLLKLLGDEKAVAYLTAPAESHEATWAGCRAKLDALM
jgi:hypothetical protein